MRLALIAGRVPQSYVDQLDKIGEATGTVVASAARAINGGERRRKAAILKCLLWNKDSALSVVSETFGSFHTL